VLVGECTRGGPRRDAKLGEDVLQMPCDSVLAEDQRRGDLPVAQSGRDQTKDLPLTEAKAAYISGVLRRGESLKRRQVGLGAELGEGSVGRLKLQLGRVFVAQQATSSPD
jgi:hypothetical protein